MRNSPPSGQVHTACAAHQLLTLSMHSSWLSARLCWHGLRANQEEQLACMGVDVAHGAAMSHVMKQSAPDNEPSDDDRAKLANGEAPGLPDDKNPQAAHAAMQIKALRQRCSTSTTGSN